MHATTSPIPTPAGGGGYDCAALDKLPFGGTEILYASSFFLLLTMVWGLVYADIVFKQWFSGFVDPTVLQLIAQVKAQLPNLQLSVEQKKRLYKKQEEDHDVDCSKVPVLQAPECAVTSHYAIAADGTPVEYDAVAAQESYIANKTIDLDLVIPFLNNSNFSTMSEYSADTVRGYNMLSVMLTSAGFSLTFLSMHNFYVDPRAIAPGWLNVSWGVLACCLYPGILCTAIVMTGPSSFVFRNSNICLNTNVPSNINGSKNPVRGFHVLGVVLFGLSSIIHVIQLLSWGTSMPNFATEATLLGAVLLGAAVFGIGNIWSKIFPSSPATTGNNVSITGEWLMMICAFLSCAHWEAYPTMYCSNNVTPLNSMIFTAFFAPFAWVVRSQLWSPTTYATMPSLLLMRNGQPTGTWGPASVLAYHGEIVPTAGSTAKVPKHLPHVSA